MSNLTLSQALRQVKKLKGKLSEANDRAARAVSYPSDTKPAFSFSKSVEEAAALAVDLVDLQTAVAVTNATTKIEFDGKKIPLAAAVRLLEELKGKVAWLKALPVRAQETTVENDRVFDGEKYADRKVSWACELPEAKRAAAVQVAQDTFDRLNDLVETANHSTPLAKV